MLQPTEPMSKSDRIIRDSRPERTGIITAYENFALAMQNSDVKEAEHWNNVLWAIKNEANLAYEKSMNLLN